MNSKVLTKTNYQLYPLGDAAIVVQFGFTIDTEILHRISAFSVYLAAHTFPGFSELVPAYTSVTIYYDPWIVSEKGKIDPYQKVVETLQKRLAKAPAELKKEQKSVVEIPVCYGGDFGPDLEYVAEHNQLTTEEVITLHTAGEYVVYMIGFAPGFPYLGGLNDKIAAPRKTSPRASIPAGSVGIAGAQTGIYPLETPGGWQLIGRTPVNLFDTQQKQPSLLQAGNTVRFTRITEDEFGKRKGLAT